MANWVSPAIDGLNRCSDPSRARLWVVIFSDRNYRLF